MRRNLPILHMARICLETRTGLSLASGLSEGGYDVLLVRDANGLPALPGSSLAGVLRHLYQELYGQDETNRLFGSINQGQESPSLLQVSWGVIHDQHNQPVEGGLLGAEIKRLEGDPVLRFLSQPQPVMRDHVSLNHRGAAADKTKFDRGVLPPGCRFSLELSLMSDNLEDLRWEQILMLLHPPIFRLGGATRRGLGAFQTPSIHHLSLDLQKTDHFARLAALKPGVGDKTGMTIWKPVNKASHPVVTATINLEPEDYWRFGQGDEPILPTGKDSKPPRQLPLRHPRIIYSGDHATITVKNDILIPASAIKGALRHRFVFHLLRHQGKYVEIMVPGEVDSFDFQELTEVRDLFGFAKDGDEGGQVGHLLIDDLCLPCQNTAVGRMMHNGQDRFTGGVRSGVLFGEELLWKQGLTLRITIFAHKPGLKSLLLRRALADTLDDLAQGRLALGAGSSKGHGYWKGQWTWSDGGGWIQSREAIP